MSKPPYCIYGILLVYKGGGGSSVSIARYGFEGPVFELRWGRDFPYPFIPAQHFVQWVTALFPGGKAAGEWR